jgi:hypothetical protein
VAESSDSGSAPPAAPPPANPPPPDPTDKDPKLAELPADPLLTAKANLRDTIKWLATTFAGVAALVLAGTSLSGISNLHGPGLVIGLGGAVVGFACVLLVIGRLLQLLTGEVFYFSDLQDPRNRQVAARIDRNAIDLLPATVPNLALLFQLRKDTVETLRELAVKKEDKTPAFQEQEKYLNSLTGPIMRVTYFGQFEVLRERLTESARYLFGFSILAVFGLVTFVVAVGSAKDKAPDKPPTMVANVTYAFPGPQIGDSLLNGQPVRDSHDVLINALLAAAIEKAPHKDQGHGGFSIPLSPLVDLLHSFVSAGLITKDAAESIIHELTTNALDAGKEILVDFAKKAIDKVFSPAEDSRLPISINVSTCCSRCPGTRSTPAPPKPKAATKPDTHSDLGSCKPDAALHSSAPTAASPASVR